MKKCSFERVFIIFLLIFPVFCSDNFEKDPQDSNTISNYLYGDRPELYHHFFEDVLKRPSTKRIIGLKSKIVEIFKSQTGRDEFGKNIYDFEIENWPDYVPMKSLYWDDQALVEIESALQRLKFHEKPPYWKPFPWLNGFENEFYINRKRIHQELVEKCEYQMGVYLSMIHWSSLYIINWPDEVGFRSSDWSIKDIMKIARRLDSIGFEAKSSEFYRDKFRNEYDRTDLLVRDKSTIKKALTLHSMICDKFESELNVPRSAIEKFRIDPWPEYVPIKIPELWDNLIIEQIEQIFPRIKFIPRDSLHTREYGKQLSIKLKDRYLSQTGSSVAYIRWSELIVVGWPRGLSKSSSNWSSKDLILVSRALDSMQFILKKSDENNFQAIQPEFDHYCPYRQLLGPVPEGPSLRRVFEDDMDIEDAEIADKCEIEMFKSFGHDDSILGS